MDVSGLLPASTARCGMVEPGASRISRLTYNLTEPRNHSYIVGGTVVANCSEYVHLDNSSCNLASINLLKFLE